MKFEVLGDKKVEYSWSVGDYFIIDKDSKTELRRIVRNVDKLSILEVITGKIFYQNYCNEINDINSFMKKEYPRAVKVIQKEPVQFEIVI